LLRCCRDGERKAENQIANLWRISTTLLHTAAAPRSRHSHEVA